MPLPYELVEVPGAQAVEKLAALSKQGAVEGFVPVILGDKDDAERANETFDQNEEDIATALSRFSSRPDSADEVLARLREELIAENDEEFEDEFDTVTVEDVPDEGEPGSLSAHLDRNGKPKKSVFIAKVATSEPWLVPIHLKFGAWNSCPESVDHAILAKHWADKYGAKVAAITGDTVEFSVERPPATKEEALKLAKEHYTYCTDIVDQGVGDIQSLAAVLLNANYWFFWWD